MCRELSWDTLTKLQADALLHEWIGDQKAITSLGLKCELRRRLALIDPASRRNIVQEDVGYWLREKERDGYWESLGYIAFMRNGHYVYAAKSEKLWTFPDFTEWLKSQGWVACDDSSDDSSDDRVFYRSGVRLSLRPSSETLRTYRYSGEATIGPWVCKLGELLNPEDLKNELLAALSYLPDTADEKAPQEVNEVHEEVEPDEIINAQVDSALDVLLADLDAVDEFQLIPLPDAVDEFQLIPLPESDDYLPICTHPNA